MNTKSAVLAAAAAALFTAGMTGAAGTANAAHHEIHCEGVNSCKGQTDCGAGDHDCSGKNACKGKGWKSMSAEECETAKEAMKEG
jgi:hypothetical protein